jgi:LPS-assembly lipoprotein
MIYQFQNLSSSSRVVTTLLILTIITGCGFHLRGAVQFPTWLHSVYITPDDPYEPLQRNIHRIFENNKITIVTEINKETAVQELTTPTFTESILALNANGQPQRFRLAITVQYKLTYDNKVLCPTTVIQRTRDFTISPMQILSSENERRLIKDELLQEVTSQLLRQLSIVKLPSNVHETI